MAISKNTFPRRFTAIDDTTRDAHYWLTDEDECAYIGEYVSPGEFRLSTTNQLISNFKKSVKRKHLPDYPYKYRAIDTVAGRLDAMIPDPTGWTFVPMPTSKTKAHPEYDNRLVVTLAKFARLSNKSVDVRELLLKTVDTDPAHNRTTNRPKPPEHVATMAVDETCAQPEPSRIILFDDVITAGATFKGAQWRVRERFPSARVVGMFIARRIFKDPPEDDFGDVF